MRIVFFEAVQDFGGARMSTIELAQRLQRSHEVLIVDCYGCCEPFLKRAQAAGLNVKVILPRKHPFVIRPSGNKIVGIFRTMYFVIHSFVLSRHLKKQIEEFKPDCIVMDNTKCLSILSWISKSKLKVVFFARGWFIGSAMSFIDRYLLSKKVDSFACVSESTRQALFSCGVARLENLYVVHNAIDSRSLVQGPGTLESSDEFVILHSGGFVKGKGQHISVEIARVLKERGYKFKVILMGPIYDVTESKEYHSSISQRIVDLDIQENVSIVVNPKDPLSYLQRCNVLIHPSATEGLPRVIMEAMAHQKPVIANAVGGVTDYILHGFTGFLPHPNSVDDYVYYLEQLLKDADLSKAIGLNGFHLVQRCFTPEQQERQFEKVLL